MPTHNRRLFIPKAIEYFLYQYYPNRELIIIIDGTEPVSDLIPDNPNIRYLYQDQMHSVGAKRNIACKNSNGEIIIHWDDDDWMADWRISYQVKNLLARQSDICGLSRLFFFNPAANLGWEYICECLSRGCRSRLRKRKKKKKSQTFKITTYLESPSNTC